MCVLFYHLYILISVKNKERKRKRQNTHLNFISGKNLLQISDNMNMLLQFRQTEISHFKPLPLIFHKPDLD